MSKNLGRLLAVLKAEADLIDQINLRADLRYKSVQRLLLETGKPFIYKVQPAPFKGKPKSCFENCFQALWNHPQLSYCEGFVIDDDLPIAISHAWLVNDSFEVVDPTWNDQDSTGCTYFGVIFHKKFVFDFAAQTRHYGILDSNYLNDYQILRFGFPQGALHNGCHSTKF